MNKFVPILCLVGVCLAEPPVDRYLPASRGSKSSHGSPSSSYGAPSQQYGSPNGAGFGSHSSSYSGSSSQYSQNRGPSSQYGAPGSGSGGYDDNMPAKYDFKYDVNAPEYNVDFGHEEQRDGDLTQGSYYVVLPDGRRQLVEYTADAEGYKPKISYTEGNGGAGGYGNGGGYQGNGAGGYHSGGQGGYQSGGHSGY